MKGKLIKKEDDFYSLRVDGLVMATSNGMIVDYKLSLKNCQAIENGYDLDELAYIESEDFVENFDYNDGHGNICRFNNSHEVQECYIKGFQKALEILGDKKFSKDDMKIAFNKGAFYGSTELGNTHYFDEVVQSLQQTEWEVEIVTKPYTEVNEGFNLESKREPKLDAENCLILKRKV